MSAERIDVWIKVGYKLLGNEGMEGMKIERLARMLKLNKSGFYYYFGSMDAFFKRLIEYHTSLALTISEEIDACEKFDPDLLLLVVRHKEFFLVESNLIGRSKTALNGHFDEAGKVISKAVLPLWRKTTGMEVDPAAAVAYVDIIKHFLYARIDREHIDYEFLHTLIAETREVLSKVATERHVLR
jgi:AcrR family transcriptional regulator